MASTHCGGNRLQITNPQIDEDLDEMNAGDSVIAQAVNTYL